MPYPGAELQAYLCRKWAKDNGYLYDPNGDVFIRVADGYEVATPLPDDENDVLVTAYKANGLIKIDNRKTSMPKPYGKRKRCKTAKEAVAALTSTPDGKPPRKCTADDTAVLHTDVTTEDTPSNCTTHNRIDTSIGNNGSKKSTPEKCGSEVAPDYKYTGDYDLQRREDGRDYRVRTGGDDVGIVDGLCQDYETARASYMQKKNECLNSCDFRKSCALTLTTYIKQSFDDVQKAIQSLAKKDGFLFKRYENLKCVCYFLEPYADGGWHSHMILSFYDSVPTDLHEDVLANWKKCKTLIVPTDSYKTDENLVDLRYFYTVDEFAKYLDYLNPVSKKKRGRLKFYPYKRRARQFYGDYESPNGVIMPSCEAKKLTKCERPALRHEIKILNASNTVFEKEESLKLYNFTYYYTTSKKLWDAIIMNEQSEENNFCERESTSPVTAPNEAVTSVFYDYDDESERDNSRWSDYVYDNYTVLHLRC